MNRRGKAILLHPEAPIPQQVEGERSSDARLRAARAGSKIYRALKTCRTCGTDVRYVYGGGCVTCVRVYARARYQQHRILLMAAATQHELEQLRN